METLKVPVYPASQSSLTKQENRIWDRIFPDFASGPQPYATPQRKLESRLISVCDGTPWQTTKSEAVCSSQAGVLVSLWLIWQAVAIPRSQRKSIASISS